jgi:protein SCO1/2
VLATCLAVGLCAAQAHPSCAQVTTDAAPLFELTDHAGRHFTPGMIAGRPYALFFGFTHCPDVCPTTLLAVSNLLQRLGADADRLSVVFVTVDPERDSAEVLRQYLAAFDPRIVGLTGSEVQTAAVARSWNAFHEKIPEAGGTYTVVHSAYIYLMDDRGRLAATMSFQDGEDEQLAKVRALLAHPGGN